MGTDSVSAAVWLNLVHLFQNPPYLSLYWDHESPQPCPDSQACPGSVNMLEKWIAQVQVMILVQMRCAVAIAIGACVMCTHVHGSICVRVHAHACVCICYVNTKKLMTSSLLLSYCTLSLKG